MSPSSAPFWVWWLLPVAVTAVVLAGAAVARRDRRPKDGFDSIDDYRRFRTAMTHVRGADEPEQP